MKTQLIKSAKYGTALLMMLFANIVAFAQESPQVNVNGHDVGNWFSRNWIWIAGIIIVLLLIVIFGMGSKTSKSTTTISRNFDGDGVTRTTTTSVNE